MKLSVRMVKVMGENKLALFDETGKILPGQRDVVLNQPLKGVTTVTVTFVVGGEITLELEPGRP